MYISFNTPLGSLRVSASQASDAMTERRNRRWRPGLTCAVLLLCCCAQAAAVGLPSDGSRVELRLRLEEAAARTRANAGSKEAVGSLLWREK